jgi:hypothetical protein
MVSRLQNEIEEFKMMIDLTTKKLVAETKVLAKTLFTELLKL